MSKLPNIIQRRELEPLLHKANKVARHYEKAANCAISVMSPEFSDEQQDNTAPILREDCHEQLNYMCKNCRKIKTAAGKKSCSLLHHEAVNKARQLGGSYIYACPEGKVFWTSPFYSGERFAGAFLSGGVREDKKNNAKVKSLANMMMMCADQISRGPDFLKAIKLSENSETDSEAENLKSPEETEQTAAEIENDQTDDNDICLIDLERMLLADLRRGDNIEAKKILINLLDIHYREMKNNFPAFRHKAIELAVLLSRAVSDSREIDNNAILETNNQYLKKIEESADFQEIKETLFSFTDKISGNIFSFHGVRHFPALRKAERFIWENYTRKISLQEIAAVSGLSAPYFSTIFKEEMGENLSDYLNRLRVEKAAAMLVSTNLPISEIAKTCGFEDQSWFSKIFKINTGLTPGKYRDQGSISGLSA